MAPRYVIGVDGGTESLRAGVFDTAGARAAVALAGSSANTRRRSKHRTQLRAPLAASRPPRTRAQDSAACKCA